MAINLSSEKLHKARHYLMEYGRDIEQHLYRFHFENGNPYDLIFSLKAYQGENGGFRNMGEGDSTIPNAMDTSMAFQYLSEVGATSADEIVQKGIQYLINAYDRELKCWHARPNENSHGWLDNPCAELLGYLYEYRELVPEAFLERITEDAIASISTVHTSEEPRQFYFLTALCILRLAVRIDEPYKTSLMGQLLKDIPDIIEKDSEKWSRVYCAKPFFFAHSPDSPMFLSIRDHVIRSLENEIKTQAEDGHFILNWDCSEDAAKVWRSIWTIDVLKALLQHGLIES